MQTERERPDVGSTMNDMNGTTTTLSAADMKQLEQDALKKEDDDFAALEAKFMTELGLQ